LQICGLMRVRTTRRYRRDIKKARKGGRDKKKLQAVIDTIAAGERLPRRHRQHNLSGNWEGHIECHIEGDWLLIWREEADEIVLVRTGTHAELFG